MLYLYIRACRSCCTITCEISWRDIQILFVLRMHSWNSCVPSLPLSSFLFGCLCNCTSSFMVLTFYLWISLWDSFSELHSPSQHLSPLAISSHHPPCLQPQWFLCWCCHPAELRSTTWGLRRRHFSRGLDLPGQPSQRSVGGFWGWRSRRNWHESRTSSGLGLLPSPIQMSIYAFRLPHAREMWRRKWWGMVWAFVALQAAS